MGKKSPGQKMTVVDYFLSIHFGICAGPVDYLHRILVGEKVAWAESLPGEAGTQLTVINQPNLFGGKQKEGGVQGQMEFMPGKSDQLMASYLTVKLGLTPSTCPAYRGITTIFMVGGPPSIANGFLWSTNTPYLKTVWAEVERCFDDWYPETARITRIGAIPAYPAVTAASGLTGNTAFKWDTCNNVVARFESFIGFQTWNIQTGAVIFAGGTGGAELLGGFGHILSNNQIMSGHNTAGGTETSIRIFDIDGTFKQSISVTTASGLISFWSDDITINGTHYAYAYIWDAFSHAYTALLSRNGDTWGIENYQAATPSGSLGSPPIHEVSLGVEYAYHIKHADTTKIIRVTIADLSCSEITPPGLTDNIDLCHYNQTYDIVVIVCEDGNLFTFTPDLSTQLTQATDPIPTPFSHTASWRPYSNNNVIAFACRPDTFQRRVREYALPNLGLVREINTADFAAYSAGTTYTKNDVVTSGGDVYYSLIDSNLGNTPSSSPSAWRVAYINYAQADPTVVSWNPTWKAGWFGVHFGSEDVWFLPSVGRVDANPAHIIYEALTNTSWGMSTPTYALDDTAFRDAASTLYAESFGLSLMWVQQDTIENFIREILDHINGVLYISPQTGLIVLKLIRDDYTAGSLDTFDESNCTITNFQRKSWGDTVNEIVVSWTNPENEEQETISWQDLSNIAIQGGIVSDSRNYYGVRTRTLAQQLVMRDLRVASTPLATAEIEVNREGWNKTPADVFKLSSTEYGFSDMVVRIVNIDYGKPDDAKIKMNVIEDVFAYAQATFVDVTPTSIHDPGNEDPADAAYRLAMTQPYYTTAGQLGTDGFTDPEVLTGIFVGQTGSDTHEYDLYGDGVDAFGNVTIEYLGVRNILSYTTLAVQLDQEITSSFDPTTQFNTITQGEGPVVSGFALIGGASGETECELVGITNIALDGTITLMRGLLDTTPKVWPIGTGIFFFSGASNISDARLRSAAEDLTYKALTRTTNGTLSIDDATDITMTATERPYLSTRPANVQIDAEPWGPIDYSNTTPPSTFDVTWVNRNRLTEDSQVLQWDDPTVTVETSQTTTITILDNLGGVINTIDGLTGTSHTLNLTDWMGAGGDTFVKVTSKRDGFESLQGHKIMVKLPEDEYTSWLLTVM